jgi:1-acyl-sn-glycerol-3-phosphate acyltransferase
LHIAHLSSLRSLTASALSWASVLVFTVLLFLVMLLVTATTLPFDPRRRLQHALCFWWSDAVIGVNPYWKVDVQGLDHIDHDRTYVIVANHQSVVDIVLLFQTRMQFKWIAKDSLFRVPFLGWCMSLARHIRLRRARLSSIRTAYQEASAWIDNGVSVMFFPEGTRSASGEMLDFHAGPFKLALKKNVAVLPMAIHGTARALPRGTWRFNPGSTVGLTVLPAIKPENFQNPSPDSLKKTAWERIQNALRAAGDGIQTDPGP